MKTDLYAMSLASAYASQPEVACPVKNTPALTDTLSVSPRCECPEGYPGPNCEGLTIHFEGTGYAWFPRLTACNASHLSFDVTTGAEEGLILYNGPLAQPTKNVHGKSRRVNVL